MKKAILFMALAIAVYSNVAITVAQSPPLSRAPLHSGEGAHVFACQAKEDYVRFASDPDVKMALFRAVNQGRCININDRAEYASDMQPHHYYRIDHITEDGFACVWAIKHKRGGCLWTAANNLKHIGRGLQLSEDQFRDVRTLYAQVEELRKLGNDYILQAQGIKNRQGDRQEEARLRAIAKHADDQAYEVEERISRFKPTERSAFEEVDQPRSEDMLKDAPSGWPEKLR